MTLAAGKKLGPYEILGPLGAGGMGEVYRAKDTRLDRTVAVKVLPLHLSADADAKARFDREARSISSLAHPNICHLYDVGHQDGTDFLVMEFLEGETLAARIQKGPLPTEQVFKVGTEICDGLERAHKMGVVHRDLKPANIMLTKSGAKLMDFGLAKQTQAVAPPSSSLTSPLMSPVPSGPLTQAGTIVGTFQYMSPEQVEGKDADPRSDIFSLGAVLYEMATAHRAFEGKTTASVIAAILERDPPPISSVQPNSPLMLERLVKTCLAKDPDERWQTAHDVKLQLQSMREAGSQLSVASSAAASAAAAEAASTAASVAAAAQTRRNRDRTLLILGTALLTAIVAGALGYMARPPKPETKLNATITLPPNLQIEPFNISFAFSPDSQKIAFVGVGADGRSNIYIRPLDTDIPQLLAGTEGAASPFWSPDGHSIGFFADKKLKRIDVANASVSVLCDAPAGRGGAWSPDGLILFAPSNQTGLSTVSATGGTPTPITALGSETGTDRVPFFLPDGKHALFVRSGLQFTLPGTVYILDVSSKKIEKLFDSDSEAQYAEPGYLLFSRDGNLLAQSFNASSMKLSGEPIVIAQHIAFNAARRAAQFAVSKSGLLLYAQDTGVSLKQLTWFNLDDGTELSKLGEPNRFLWFRLSPDDHRAVAAISESKSSSIASDKSVWIYDLARASTLRLTFSSGAYEFPVWSGDGQSVFYVDDRPPVPIMRKSANGNSEAAKVFADGMLHQINAASPDGQSLAFSTQIPRDFRIDMLPLAGDPKPATFLAQDSNARGASFSPDGKWLSYLSDQTGRYELYVVPYPGPGGKWQVSKDGVIQGGWLKAPNKLAYLGNDSKLYIVDVSAKGANFEIIKTKNVFGGHTLPATSSFITVQDLITGDAKRIIVPKVMKDDAPNSVTLITNWSSDLKKP
jgi:eukaryotic-like serine/threonine-protein kinase